MLTNWNSCKVSSSKNIISSSSLIILDVFTLFFKIKKTTAFQHLHGINHNTPILSRNNGNCNNNRERIHLLRPGSGNPHTAAKSWTLTPEAVISLWTLRVCSARNPLEWALLGQDKAMAQPVLCLLLMESHPLLWRMPSVVSSYGLPNSYASPE